MMAGDLMQGAAIGALFGVAFDKLFTLFLDAIQRAARFPSDLDRLQTTLCSIKTALDDIESCNRYLERPPYETGALTARLIEGEKLIQKCSNINHCNPCSKWYYSKKLNEFEALLANSFQIYAAAFNCRQNDHMATMLKSIEIGRCSSNDSAGVVIGFENSCEEQSGMQLLEEGEIVMELSEVAMC